MSDPHVKPHSPEPAFGDALVQFTAFVVHQGLSPNLLWVFREDILERWPLIYVRLPLMNEVSAIEALYRTGVERGLGIEMSVVCLLGGSPCCYLYLPDDTVDSEQRMMSSGLKLSVPSELSVATPITNWAKWTWLTWWTCRGSKPRWSNDLPRRHGGR